MKANPDPTLGTRLTKEQAEILKLKKFEASKTREEWLELFHNMSVYYESRLPMSRWLTGLVIGSIILGIVMLLVGLVRGPIWILIVGGCLIVVAIGGIIARKKITRAKFAPTLGEFFGPLLILLKADIKGKYPIKIAFDFGDRFTPYQLVNNPPAYWKKGKGIKYYQTRWMAVSMKFMDGASIHWAVDFITRQRTRTKMSASGKFKTKRKRKTKAIINYKFVVPADRYAIKAKASEKVAVASTAEAHTLKLRRKILCKSEVPTLPMGGILKEVRFLYNCLILKNQNA